MENKNETLKDTALILEYKIREAHNQSQKPGLIVLLHGVGSNEEDLFRLAGKFPTDFVVVSARAPYTLAHGRYAWFQVDLSKGKPVINPEQAEKSRLVLNTFVNQLIDRYSIDANKVYMGGFSQGGIMSYSVGLTFPQKFKGIFILSSRLLSEVKPLIKAGAALVRNAQGAKLYFIDKNGNIIGANGEKLGMAKKNGSYYNINGENVLNTKDIDKENCAILDPQGHNFGTTHKNYKLHACAAHCYWLMKAKEKAVKKP